MKFFVLLPVILSSLQAASALPLPNEGTTNLGRSLHLPSLKPAAKPPVVKPPSPPPVKEPPPPPPPVAKPAPPPETPEPPPPPAVTTKAAPPPPATTTKPPPPPETTKANLPPTSEPPPPPPPSAVEPPVVSKSALPPPVLSKSVLPPALSESVPSPPSSTVEPPVLSISALPTASSVVPPVLSTSAPPAVSSAVVLSTSAAPPASSAAAEISTSSAVAVSSAASAVVSSAVISVASSAAESSIASVTSSAASSASSSAASSASASASSSAASASASCGPVPKNTIANLTDAVPDQYIVSLKPNTELSQHLKKVQTAITSDALCNDPGAPKTAISTKGQVQNDADGSIYRGVFSDRDVAFIKTTSEFQSITRDRKAVASRKRVVGKRDIRKRAVGQSWNLARLAQPAKLEPGSGQPGQGTSDTTSDWTVDLQDNIGQNVFIYVIDTGVDDEHPLLTPRVKVGSVPGNGGQGNEEGDGHGTEVAGAAAATKFGVASGATIVPIKIYGSAQQGFLSDLVDGVNTAMDDFVIKKQLNSNAAAVINISIESPNDQALQTAIAQALAMNMHVVVAAGNGRTDRCNGDWVTTSENTNVQAAINVGATDINDNIAVFSSAEAPGSNFGNTKLAFGTSLAAPQVAGIIAGIIQQEGNVTPAEMKAKILSLGTPDKIQFTGPSAAANNNNLIAQLPESLLDLFGDFQS
ncbi:peptidase S8/S53 domain-containing protein [Mycena maculata]|uniref:Peptidase S8/S53 domain-containing protein n=1 Tax=Mycena maculata TaxID=230809 RepID=A0AAD7K4I2_9AGAR|nr:peptidase S8/S53 domain-containing protein [Mycena maculata]